jgi:SecD/SecF fusion protein
MQNKGAIKLFAIVFGLVCLYQLSFTWVAKSVEEDARTYANGDATKEQYFLDSISGEGVYDIGVRDYTYSECKNRELNLGLDLKGGMNVILEVSVQDIIRSLANNSKEPVFNKAIAAAKLRQRDSQESFLDLFEQEFAKANAAAANPVALNSPTIFGTRELRDRITIDADDAAVMRVVREEAEGAIDRAFTVLRARIDKFGVAQPNIQRLGTSGRILVELPGVKDADRVKKLLQSTAQLEFWHTYDNREVIGFLEAANLRLRDLVEQTVASKDAAADDLSINDLGIENVDGDSTVVDSVATDSLAALNAFNPLYDILIPNLVQNAQGGYTPGEGPFIGFVEIKDTALVNEYLSKPQILDLIPSNMKFVKFLWTAQTTGQDGRYLQLCAIKSNREDVAQLGGDKVTNAVQDYDEFGRASISMNMNAEGAKIWKKMTTEASADPQNTRSIAVVLDNYVYSAPNVGGPIPNGRSQISGSFTVIEAQDLSNVLKAGKLPAPARIIQAEIVGPSLGQEAVDAGFQSFMIALLLVLLYMIFYYGKAGLASNLALLINMFFIFGVLSSLGAVLTLPGIAGIVLTIGMAVDANVLIYERIREELSAGKGLQLAISDGYKNAYSSIIDANVTTLLTGIILYVFGTGPIRGFATTLIIGILTSLFAAIFITRLVFAAQLAKKKNITFSTAVTKGAFTKFNIGFLNKRKMYYVVSGLIIAAGIFSLSTRGLNQGVDFTGGRSFQVRFDQTVNTTDVREALSKTFVAEGQDVGIEVKTFGSDNQVRITTNFMVEETGIQADAIVNDALYSGLAALFANDIDKSAFFNENETKEAGLMSYSMVGPTIADDIKQAAFWSILFSLIVIFLYILLRFRKWQYSLGAVVAVFHDVLIVLSVFSIFNGILPFSLEIDQAFIAAILTVIGYSINDTVVVFDRIREMLGNRKKEEVNTVVNRALNTTLSRTINTSLTTFFVLLVIFIFGGEVIRGFMFALMVGVIVGTYSSVCIATPVMVDTLKKTDEKIRK